jgi:hypothetical protein
MSKRLVVKLAVMVAALGAVTLLQGCGGDEEGVDWRFVYMPCIPGSAYSTLGYATSASTAGGTGQSTGSVTAGATAAAGAAMGGGGGQVSGGGM